MKKSILSVLAVSALLVSCGQKNANDSKTSFIQPQGDYLVLSCHKDDYSFSITAKAKEGLYVGHLTQGQNSTELNCAYVQNNDLGETLISYSCSNKRPARVNIGVNIIEEPTGNTKAEIGIIPVPDQEGMYPEALFATIPCGYIYY